MTEKVKDEQREIKIPSSTIRKIHRARANRDAGLNNTAPVRLASNTIPQIEKLAITYISSLCDSIYPIARAAKRNTLYNKDVQLLQTLQVGTQIEEVSEIRIPYVTIRRIHKERASIDAGLNNTAPIRISSSAIPTIEKLAITYIAKLCDGVYPIAKAAGRNTVYGKDIELLLTLRVEKQ